MNRETIVMAIYWCLVCCGFYFWGYFEGKKEKKIMNNPLEVLLKNMRRSKYRALKKYNNVGDKKIVYGFAWFRNGDKVYLDDLINPDDGNTITKACEIYPESLERFSGLYDFDYKEVYERIDINDTIPY